MIRPCAPPGRRGCRPAAGASAASGLPASGLPVSGLAVSGLAVSVLAVAGLAVAPAPGALASVVDGQVPVALAAAGTTAAWLRPSDPRGDHARLVVLDGPDAAARVVDQPLPDRPIGLSIGTATDGTPTAVIATASTALRGHASRPHPGRGALYALPLNGSRAPERLPVSVAGADLAAPGLYRGRLSFAQREGERWTLRVGGLRTARSRVVARGGEAVDVSGSTPVGDGRVAYATSEPVPATSGARYVLRLARPGGGGRRISSFSVGGAATNERPFGPLTVAPDGSSLSAVRGGAGLYTWALPSGRRLDVAPLGLVSGVAAPLGDAVAVTVGGDDPQVRVEPLVGR